MSSDGDNANGEPYPYITRITCDDPIAIRYVKQLIADTNFQEGGQLRKDTDVEIGELSWKFPWKNGSMEIGYPPAIPRCDTKIQRKDHASTVNGDWSPSWNEKPQLYVRTSDENENWSEVQTLSVPFDVPSSGQASSNWNFPIKWYLPSIVATSNGEHFVFAIQKRGDTHVSVWTSDDLTNWNESIIPLPQPTGLHPVLDTTTSLGQIMSGPQGWLLRVTIEVKISEYRLLPKDLAKEMNWPPRCYFDYYARQDGEDGVMVCWYDEESNRYEKDPNRRFVPWEDLNMDEDMIRRYGGNLFGNKPYLRSPNFSGWVWPAKWGENPDNSNSDGWIELPYVHEKVCCELLRTDAGYLALTIPWFPGYSPLMSGPQRLFFSPGGYVWADVDTPEDTYWRIDESPICEEPYYSYYFIESIERFEDEVLVTAINSNAHWIEGWVEGPDTTHTWVIEPDGTNWRILNSNECKE